MNKSQGIGKGIKDKGGRELSEQEYSKKEWNIK